MLKSKCPAPGPTPLTAHRTRGQCVTSFSERTLPVQQNGRASSLILFLMFIGPCIIAIVEE